MVDINPNKKEPTLQEKIEKEFLNKPTPPNPQQTAKNNGPLKSLRTYQGDIEETLAKTNGSIASVAIAEEKRRGEEEKIELKQEAQPVEKQEPENNRSNPELDSLPQQTSTDGFVYDTRREEPQSSEIKNKFFFSVGISLLIIGIITIATVYYLKSKNTTVNISQEKVIISYSQAKSMAIASSTRRDLINSILKEKQDLKLPVNSVLYLDTGDVNRFVELIAPKMPATLVRSLDSKYMLGIYSYNTNEPFIILTETDFGLSYSSMLEWEKNIVSDLGEIFSIPTSGATVVFEDEALKNKDLRIIKDADRKTVLLYTFLDRNTILITSNENIFSAILGKYMTSKISR